MTMTACMVGWAHSKFGKHENEDIETLIIRVATDALDSAGLAPADIDAVYLGTMNAGFVRQEFAASLVFQADPAFRFKPATRVENACATGSAAIHQGLNAIAARRARTVLVVGVEKMTEVSGQEVGDILIKASYIKEEGGIEGGFAGVFGRITQAYFQRYGDQSDALARIAAKNHKNGASNPLAHIQKDLGYQFCREVSDKNPFVAGPLKRTDCSLVSDGAAALVLADVDTALTMEKAVVFRAAEQVNDFLPMSKRERGDGLDAEGPGRESHSRRLDREERQAPDQPLGRAQGQGPSDRRDRRLNACSLGDAAHRHGRRHPGQGRRARRRLQHGRRRGGKLRLDPRAVALSIKERCRTTKTSRHQVVFWRFAPINLLGALVSWW
jgi:acetyl-CoA acetyltransferase